MKNINKKWFITAYTYLMFLWIVIVTWWIISWTILYNHYAAEIVSKTKSFYSAETWVEEWLLAFKNEPDVDKFVPNEAIVYEEENQRKVEYKEQKVYKKELVIKELIPTWKSIQLPFAKKDLDSRITKFHIAVLKQDPDNFPNDQTFCDTPIFDSSIEVAAFQKAKILNVDPLDYTVELNSNWNGCYLWNNATGKSSLITFSDPYSNEKVSLVWDKCIMNAKWNVVWAVFEKNIPYAFNNKGTPELEDNTCDIDCSWWTCSNYYTHSNDVLKEITGYLRYYTISNNFIWSDMSNNWLIVFSIRAVDEDSHIAMWATDDAWNPYEIPWRYINFSALWITQGWDLNEWLFTRLKLKKKFNNDLLPVFDYAMFSESEFIK